MVPAGVAASRRSQMAAVRVATSRGAWRHPFPILLMGLSCLSASCGDRTEILTVAPTLSQPPVAPVILTQGPTWSAAPIDLNLRRAPEPYVIVGDANGLDDLALAVFSIDSAILRRIIVRPDSVLPGSFCNDITWTDSLDITSLLPATFSPILENCVMYQNGSSFRYSGFYSTPYAEPCIAFPAIATASPSFGVPTKQCGSYTALSRFGIYPPALSPARNVNVTFLDVEYRGIRVTVYDATGLTATTTFPPLRLVYRSYGEKQSPP